MERRIRDIGNTSGAVLLVSALLGSTPVLAGPIATGKQTADVNGTRMTVFTYRPAGCSDPSLLLVFHGARRDAADYRDDARPLADRHCLLVIAPLFDQHAFPSWRYQRGGIVGKTEPCRIRATGPANWCSVSSIGSACRKGAPSPIR